FHRLFLCRLGPVLLSFFSPLARPPLSSTLFPYTTLFRSSAGAEWLLVAVAVATAVTGIVGAWRLLDLQGLVPARNAPEERGFARDRKSTRLNSSHRTISYAVFCLKKKKTHMFGCSLVT